MTYLQFLLVFVLVPTFFIVVLSYWPARLPGAGRGTLGWHWFGVTALAAIALFWTTPWDNYIVANGVWTYGTDRVIGVIGYVPIEEYLFFILMPAFNGALFYLILKAFKGIRHSETTSAPNHRALICILFVIVLSVALLVFLNNERFFYFSVTLLWFVPPLWLQWFFDARCLILNRRLILLSTLLPTLYLSAADHFAIRQGIWTISDQTRSGWDILGLPIEEAFFFFIVSILLSQGMVLWHRLKKT